MFKDLVIPVCQNRALWAGVTTCYAELWTSETVMVETGLLKLFQSRPGPAQGECCLENVMNFDLTLFWYSPTNLYSLEIISDCDIVLISQVKNFPTIVAFRDCIFVMRNSHFG